MSTIKHPVGSKPSKVYWRRRVLVGLGVLAVIIVIVLIVVRPGAGSADPKTPLPGQATATHSSKPKSTPTPASTVIPTTPAKADGAPCDPKDVVVEAITDSNSYQSGQMPKLSLSLTNTGKKSCAIDAGTATQVFTITSGTEPYWTSTDCQKDAVHTKVLLLPGKTVTSTPIAWDRTRSDPATCDQDRDPVPAGGASYHLRTSVDGIESAETKQFLLY